jgi:hypothetical protein
MPDAQPASADLALLAAEAYVYGFPLVFDVQEVERYTRNGIGDVPATPMNKFGHASRLAGPETKFVSINNDTVYYSFDYNLDFFEIGALDDGRWKLPENPTRYLIRASAARGGLWGNHGYEAAYPMVYVDGDGQPLDGSDRYELRFETRPPCGAFWSLTMYDATDFFLIENPIGRYSIGDRTPGLEMAEDGSLTIALQHVEPDDPALRAH